MNSDIKKIVQLALSEDVGDGDLTSSLLENKMIENFTEEKLILKSLGYIK